MTTYTTVITANASVAEDYVGSTQFDDLRFGIQLKILEAISLGQTDGVRNDHIATINGGNVRILSRNWNDPNAAQDWINFSANTLPGYITGTITSS